MSTLFTRHSPGALTLREAVEREKKRVAEVRKRRKAEAETLAREGRGGDTEIVHVARGEMVIPRALQTPELMAALSRAAARYRVPVQMLSVGNAMNRINPNTGVAEFDPDWWGSFKNRLNGMFGTDTADAGPKLDSVQDMPFTPPTGVVDPHILDGVAPATVPVDINPIEMYPVPEYTTLTPRRPEIGQGSGEYGSRGRKHFGIDFAVPPGKDIVAPGDGVVMQSPQDPNGYGNNQIKIDHGNGIFSQIGHVGERHVEPGDKVTAGQVIGITGDGKNRDAAGNAYGRDPQIHFEIRGGDGRAHSQGGITYNPHDWLPPFNPHH